LRRDLVASSSSITFPRTKVDLVAVTLQIHAAAHDPNATLLIATDDEDRKEKAKGLPKGFLEGRQKALDK
jgi:hypothetical protein